MTQKELEKIEEGALAMAQAMIQRAMNTSGLTKKQLATRMNRPVTFVTRMLEGDHNLTVKTFAAAIAACDRQLLITAYSVQSNALDISADLSSKGGS
jgi:hypothetical protein